MAVVLGTYVIPVEDIKVLIDGKDFAGQPTSRWLAAGLLLVEVVPGDKVLKAVKIIPTSVFTGTGKFAKAITKVNGGTTKLIFNVTDGVIDFGNRGQLAQVIGSLGTGHHAHHMIPWETGTSNVIQQAAKADKHFHLNDFLNGTPRLPSLHLTGHDIYNVKILSVLDAIERRNPNISPEDAYREITNFAEYLKDLIQRNNHLNSGEIAALINWP